MSSEITTLNQFLKKLSLHQFMEIFLSSWDSEKGCFDKFKLWPMQHEMARKMDICKKLIIPKARQNGGSTLAAAKSIKTAIESDNSDITVISKSEPDAIYFINRRIKPFLETLPKGIAEIRWPQYECQQQKVNFSNGSVIQSITTTEGSGSGMTNRLVIMDEARFIDNAESVWNSASPSIASMKEAQIMVISNSRNGSWFNTFFKYILEKRPEGIDYTFMPWNADPRRDAAWYKRERGSFTSDIDFRTEYPETETDFFLKKTDAVYPSFDPREGGRHVQVFTPEWHRKLLFGYDDGYQHYAVFLMGVYDPFSDHLSIFDELYFHQKDTQYIGEKIREKTNYWSNVHGMPFDAWKKIADTAIFAQRGQKSVAELLKMYSGIQFTKSIKYNEESSEASLRVRIESNKLTIHPRCTNLIRQVNGLQFDKNGKASDNDNDGVDVCRYLDSELKKQDKPPAEPERQAYSRRMNGLTDPARFNITAPHWQEV